MKSCTPLLIAFVLGTCVVTGGDNDTVFVALFWIGLVVIAAAGALIWTSLDQRNRRL